MTSIDCPNLDKILEQSAPIKLCDFAQEQNRHGQLSTFTGKHHLSSASGMKFMMSVPADDFRAPIRRASQLTQVTHVATDAHSTSRRHLIMQANDKERTSGRKKSLQGAWAQLGLEL